MRNVLYSDISYNNIFLNKGLNTKLGDFAGLAINNLPPLICYKTSYKLPNQDISKRTKLFTLSLTIYKIITSSKPYNGLLDKQICAAFIKGRFPDLEPLPTFRDVIANC